MNELVKIARETDKWTEIIMRAITTKVSKRWRFVSFRSKSGREWRGIVDVIAIRKDTSDPGRKPLNRGDIFEIILIQMKGGSAKFPTLEDKQRLKKVSKHHRASNIVLFEWKRGKKSQFYVLTNKLDWKEIDAAELFGT